MQQHQRRRRRCLGVGPVQKAQQLRSHHPSSLQPLWINSRYMTVPHQCDCLQVLRSQIHGAIFDQGSHQMFNFCGYLKAWSTQRSNLSLSIYFVRNKTAEDYNFKILRIIILRFHDKKSESHVHDASIIQFYTLYKGFSKHGSRTSTRIIASCRKTGDH